MRTKVRHLSFYTFLGEIGMFYLDEKRNQLGNSLLHLKNLQPFLTNAGEDFPRL